MRTDSSGKHTQGRGRPAPSPVRPAALSPSALLAKGILSNTRGLFSGLPVFPVAYLGVPGCRRAWSSQRPSNSRAAQRTGPPPCSSSRRPGLFSANFIYIQCSLRMKLTCRLACIHTCKHVLYINFTCFYIYVLESACRFSPFPLKNPVGFG